MTRITLLTEKQAARRLRCSLMRIAELRTEGSLPFLAGPPVLILESALNAYIEEALVRPPKRNDEGPQPVSAWYLRLFGPHDPEKTRRQDEICDIIVKFFRTGGRSLRLTPQMSALIGNITDCSGPDEDYEKAKSTFAEFLVKQDAPVTRTRRPAVPPLPSEP